MYDLTHEIPAYNIWEAAYRLNQAASYWPVETVFVSVVDPGVGSQRRSIVARTRTGHYFVNPDNGILTLIAETMGIEEVRVIDEKVNRLKNSGDSYTFHGRDVYAYTGARLAAGVIKFHEIGNLLEPDIVRLQYQKAVIENDAVKGGIDILDIQYGNVWTNIDQKLLQELKVQYGDRIHVTIFDHAALKFDEDVVFGKTFSAVAEGQPVAYINSLMKFSVAINMGDFAQKYGVQSGQGWTVIVRKQKK
jgi:S-adenosylmethionine hydrolase